MIRTELTGRNYTYDTKLERYVDDKLSSLDKYLPRRVRSVAYLEVTLSDDPSGREDNRYVCDVLLSLPDHNLHSSEGAVNIYAAVDIVAAKLKAQLHTYKDKHTSEPRRRRMLSRLIGRSEDLGTDNPE